MSLSKYWKTLKDRGAWCAAIHGVAKSQDTLQMNNIFSIQKKSCWLEQFLKGRD